MFVSGNPIFILYQYFCIFVWFLQWVYLSQYLSVYCICCLWVLTVCIVWVYPISFIVLLEHSWHFTVFLYCINKILTDAINRINSNKYNFGTSSLIIKTLISFITLPTIYVDNCLRLIKHYSNVTANKRKHYAVNFIFVCGWLMSRNILYKFRLTDKSSILYTLKGPLMILYIVKTIIMRFWRV